MGMFHGQLCEDDTVDIVKTRRYGKIKGTCRFLNPSESWLIGDVW
jgi:hypothetical protein